MTRSVVKALAVAAMVGVSVLSLSGLYLHLLFIWIWSLSASAYAEPATAGELWGRWHGGWGWGDPGYWAQA
jgi:hypothetical protein